MRKSAPPFLAIFRTRLQGELPALLYLRPWDAAGSLSDLARELGAPIPTVHREASRLVEAALLVEIKAGRTRLVRAPEDDLVTRPLTELLAVTFGALPVLTEFLSRMAGVGEAYIYGSWAARYQGEPGPTPVDSDVLVVGDADADELDEIASGETAATSRGQHPPRETQAVEASRERTISGQCQTATTRPNSARQGRDRRLNALGARQGRHRTTVGRRPTAEGPGQPEQTDLLIGQARTHVVSARSIECDVEGTIASTRASTSLQWTIRRCRTICPRWPTSSTWRKGS
jgi:hypothetical protein